MSLFLASSDARGILDQNPVFSLPLQEYAEWDWTKPVKLAPVKRSEAMRLPVWGDADSDLADVAVVLTPVYPSSNSARYVTASTQAILTVSSQTQGQNIWGL